jgi:hypothetical protein
MGLYLLKEKQNRQTTSNTIQTRTYNARFVPFWLIKITQGLKEKAIHQRPLELLFSHLLFIQISTHGSIQQFRRFTQTFRKSTLKCNSFNFVITFFLFQKLSNTRIQESNSDSHTYVKFLGLQVCIIHHECDNVLRTKFYLRPLRMS